MTHSFDSTAANTVAAAATDGWRQWWLPANYAQHGGAVDLLFYVIFLVTTSIGLAVLLALVWYCIRYRHRAGLKAHFTHGNKKLELIWTIIPAILLLGLALWTKAAWDRFRYATPEEQENATKILVVAEQFNWNTIYPGPDGKFGRYLVFPKTTDPKWPALPEGQESFFSDTYSGMSGGKALPPGPAYLPPDQAKKLIDDYIAMNKLGKDFADPLGFDDDWREALGRPVYVPKGKMVRVELTSKDVIHDFFLPHFRVKLDAVPGMRGTLFFTPTQTTAEYEQAAQAAARDYPLDAAEKQVGYGVNLRVVVPSDPAAAANYTYVAEREVKKRVRGKMETVMEKTDVQLVSGDRVTKEILQGLKAKNVTSITAYPYQQWEVVCEELCGNGHTAMQGRLVVLTPEEFAEKFEGKTPEPKPTAAETPGQAADKVAVIAPAN